MNKLVSKIPEISRLIYLCSVLFLLAAFVIVSLTVSGIGGGADRSVSYNWWNVATTIVIATLSLGVTVGRMKDIGWRGKQLLWSLIVLTGYGVLILFPYLVCKKSTGK